MSKETNWIVLRVVRVMKEIQQVNKLKSHGVWGLFVMRWSGTALDNEKIKFSLNN